MAIGQYAQQNTATLQQLSNVPFKIRLQCLMEHHKRLSESCLIGAVRQSNSIKQCMPRLGQQLNC